MSEKLLFNNDWLFCEGDLKVERPVDKGPIYRQAKTDRKQMGPASPMYFDQPDPFWSTVEAKSIGWKNVNLPHDYIISQVPNEKNNNATGYFEYKNAWYRKHFNLSKEDENKRITLYFEGVGTHATVYVNGCLAKHNFCGYTSFEVDITNYVYFDKENVIAVYVTTDEFEGWWYQGGGIYRNVWLIKTDKVAIDLDGVFAKPKKICDGKWIVDFETTVINTEYEDKNLTVTSEIVDKQGESVVTVSTDFVANAFDKTDCKYSAEVENPNLWDIETPNLYTVNTMIKAASGEEDENSIRIGFRTIECDSNSGFLLNGKKTVIKGVCMHQDFGLTGLAVPENIHKHKIQLIKEMGANALRTSHYPHNKATIDACDELGIIVMDETRWFDSNEESLQQLTMLVKRDRNCPSVVFWSMGNEEGFHVNERGRKINKVMHETVRRLDDSRFIMNAVDKIVANDNKTFITTVFDDDDVIGINYNVARYEIVRERYPDKPIVASECSATSSTRGFYFPNCQEQGRCSAYDGDTTNWFLGREKTWKTIMSYGYVMGVFQWIAINYRGETVWPRLCSQSGAYDMFLQRKDAFYQNLSYWSNKPMAHLMPHWNWKGREGEDIRVVCYTNCEETELFLNGKSLGKVKVEKYSHAEWQVPYSAGELKVIAYNGGIEAAKDVIVTTGKPVAIKFKLENKCEANGKDMALFTCYCVDENGNTVPDATPTVEFYTNGYGKVVATGSDETDHIPPHITTRKMYAGAISVGVSLPSQSGKLKLYAKSELGYATFERDF